MTRIADTSFLYALFHEQDKFHEQAKSVARDPAPIAVPLEVWSETLGLMQSRSGFESTLRAEQWLQGRAQYQFVYSTHREHRHAWRLYEESRNALSFVDALVVTWAYFENASLATFDSKQQAALKRRQRTH